MRDATRWALTSALTLLPAVALAQPAAPAPTPAGEEPVPVQQPTAPATRSPAIDDAAWAALEGRQVSVDTPSGIVGGELLRSDGDTLVIVQSDGQVRTVPKAEATAVRVVQAPEPVPAPTPVQPAPAAQPTQPAPAAQPTPAQQMGNLEADPAATPAQDEQGEQGEAEEELTPGQKRRKERREKRQHALLGAFTMHGATYSHWRGDGVNAGHASYAMDWGLGANLSPGFGMYAVAGGLFGAKIRDDSRGRIKANYGHIAALFAFGGKYYYSTVGAGVAFSRLRFTGDDSLDRDKGLALPFKLVGKIPLPHKLYIGLGLTYELAMVRGFDRFVNAIGGQIVVGRW